MTTATTIPTAETCSICWRCCAFARMLSGTRLILIISLEPVLVAPQSQTDGHAEGRGEIGRKVRRSVLDAGKRIEHADGDLQLDGKMLGEILEPGHASHQNDPPDRA